MLPTVMTTIFSDASETFVTKKKDDFWERRPAAFFFVRGEDSQKSKWAECLRLKSQVDASSLRGNGFGPAVWAELLGRRRTSSSQDAQKGLNWTEPLPSTHTPTRRSAEVSDYRLVGAAMR